MLNTAYATVDLKAIQHNLQTIRELCPRSRVMAMVKADAYGHGLLQVAAALKDADGLAVARLDEALRLRRSGIQKRLLLVGTLLEKKDLVVCSELDIDITAHDRATVAAIVEGARHFPVRVWLKLDTGMRRMGLDPATFVEADRTLSCSRGVRELIHMTHLSAAEDAATRGQQLERMHLCLKHTSQAPLSVANSAAIIAEPSTHTEWVRPGISLYGVNPLDGQRDLGLRLAMTLCARVIALRHIGSGEGVGYGGRWTSSRPSLLATIGIGYGDGYPRTARDGTPVLISGKVVPLVGRVSMDSLVVDLTEADSVKPGDEAILWGPSLPTTTIAQRADTIPHELFTRLSSRVDRCYLQSVPQ